MQEQRLRPRPEALAPPPPPRTPPPPPRAPLRRTRRRRSPRRRRQAAAAWRTSRPPRQRPPSNQRRLLQLPPPTLCRCSSSRMRSKPLHSKPCRRGPPPIPSNNRSASSAGTRQRQPRPRPPVRLVLVLPFGELVAHLVLHLVEQPLDRVATPAEVYEQVHLYVGVRAREGVVDPESAAVWDTEALARPTAFVFGVICVPHPSICVRAGVSLKTQDECGLGHICMPSGRIWPGERVFSFLLCWWPRIPREDPSQGLSALSMTC